MQESTYLIPVYLVVLVFISFSGLARAAVPVNSDVTRERLSLDQGWRFALGSSSNAKKDYNFGTGYFYNAKDGACDGAAATSFDDRGWRLLDLPHDWAVELPFDQYGDTGHGAKPVGRGYPDTSVGWYRRAFDVPASDLGKRLSFEFDGAFREAQVFLNGHLVAHNASGYDSFQCDVTDIVNYGSHNTLVVRLDASLREGWFYEGAGLYRHVWLTKTNPVHVAYNGTFITADIVNGITADALSAADATLTARATINNDLADKTSFDIGQSVIDPTGKVVATGTLTQLTLEPGDSREFALQLLVTAPRLWGLQSPSLYTLVTVVEHEGKLLDRYETTFGIRTLKFDKDKGFFLNGQHVLVKGTCNHQDAAGVGIAVPDALQEFRIKCLKEMGSNAIRTSHNPPTPELLDACDRMGMLVLDENRQTGVSDEAMTGLRKLIVRDRNHPSVFLWSVGNEEWVIEGTATGTRVVAAQRAAVHRLDPSRLVTTAVSGGWGKGSSKSLDVMGFNYFTHGNVDDYHAQNPNQPCIGSEEGSTTTTRGAYSKDDKLAQLAAYGDTAPSWASTAEHWVNFYDSRPFVAGAFVWTGFDYRGETTPFGWPAISSQFGILDTCGFPKDNFYYYQSVWTDAPMVHLLPHWNWEGKEGQPIDVRCYSNCDEVELKLNGKSLGREPMKRLGRLQWSVNYEAGELQAIGYRAGKPVSKDVVQTTDKPAEIQLMPDRNSISADGRDVSVVTVRVVDSKGRTVPTAGNKITFAISGPGNIIGVGNGDPACHEPDRMVDRIQSIDLSGWKVKTAGDADLSQWTSQALDDSDWQKLDSEKTDTHKLTRVYRTDFEITNDVGSSVYLFAGRSIEGFKVFVNGQMVTDLKHLEKNTQPGHNILAIVGDSAIDTDNAKRLPASMFGLTPAGAWQRSAFYGLAQVIVQSVQTEGPVILTASGDGLKPTSVTVTTHQGAPIKSVALAIDSDDKSN